MKQTLFLACALGVLGFTWHVADPVVAGEDRHYTDGLVHYVDFFQHTEGLTELLQNMADSGIDEAMICGTPLMKVWDENAPRSPRYYEGDDAPLYWYSATDIIVARAVESLSADKRRRLHPFLVGFNPMDRNAPEHVERMLAWYPGLWQGIGEVLTRHDVLSSLTYGEAPRPNSKAMTAIYELAAQHDLPVFLHCNVTSVRERKLIYLPELKAVLRAHPQTRIIWAHAGTSAGINRRRHLVRLLPAVRSLLTEFDNLWIDLSWSMVAEYLLNVASEPDPGWVALIEDFPARFMLGSDSLGKFGHMGRKMATFEPLLAALKPETAVLVARDNFLNVLPASVKIR